MKKSLLILALPLLQLGAVSAFAASHTAAPVVATPSTAVVVDTPADALVTKGNVQVKSDAKTAAPAGDAMKNEAAAAHAVDQKHTSAKSRSEVKAEAKMANHKEAHKAKSETLNTGK